MSDRTCRQVTIARGEVAHVQHCAHCGCVSVHLGATTIRLDPHALGSLWATVAEAVEALATKPVETTTSWSSIPGKA